MSKQKKALPIELLSFEANVNEDKVDLKWVTATEIKNDYFSIERSSDAKNREEIITTNGAGNSNKFKFFQLVSSFVLNRKFRAS